MKTTYELVKRHTISNNSPEFGCGDYCETKWERLALVDAFSMREAQTAFKRMFPQLKLSFSGRFAPYHAWEVAS